MGLEALVSTAVNVIYAALDKYEVTCVAFSGGKDSTVMARLVLDVVEREGFEQPIFLLADPIPMRETVEYVKRVVKEWGISRYVFFTDIILEKHWEKAGEAGEDKQRCCYWLKVKALEDWIERKGIEALFVAIRRDEHPARARETYFSKRKTHMRIHPMLDWMWIDVWMYIKERGLPVNPLYFKGYTSLGCAPCTSKAVDREFNSIDEIVEFVKSGKVKERQGRDIDKEMIMERLRGLGYF